ncbi:hypothetical protein RvY_11726 [Ramazzottius varieornatus]|uniref:Uncharacterized protein n=1 Tax=Ramazzottius varieornatus TaxID=947166 RepID=A0A1D1VPT3_RAMVA|nr:hypothetical protein RvY_11726 [Ramazzottius varieornatus]
MLTAWLKKGGCGFVRGNLSRMVLVHARGVAKCFLADGPFTPIDFFMLSLYFVVWVAKRHCIVQCIRNWRRSKFPAMTSSQLAGIFCNLD